MTNYAISTYTTAAALHTAIEALATTVTFDIIPYRVGCTTHFMLSTPAGNAAA
jgi:hypothetical protein